MKEKKSQLIIIILAFDAKSITNNSKANEFESLDNTEVKELMEKLQRTKARLIRVNLEKKESVEEIEKLKAGKNSIKKKNIPWQLFNKGFSFFSLKMPKTSIEIHYFIPKLYQNYIKNEIIFL